MSERPSIGRRGSVSERLHRRSERSASVQNLPFPVDRDEKHVKFIDWDDPQYIVTPDDPRWILPDGFDLGSHDWYQSLPEDKQIEIGMKRIANVTRTGLEFEQALLSGIAMRNQILTEPHQYDEFRYMTHEAEEEQKHIQMFNEMVRRIGMKTYGAPSWFRDIVTPITGPAARRLPMAFYEAVLAGEEPIDHIQKQLVDMHKSGKAEIHPMVLKVMSVHIEEEARHIGTAEDLLEKYIPFLSERQLKMFAKMYPAIARAGINATLVPSDEILRYMEVPKGVAKEVWFNSDAGRQTLDGLSVRPRRRAEKLGIREPELLGKFGKKIWEKCGLEGSSTSSKVA